MRSHLGLISSSDENADEGIYVASVPPSSCAHGQLNEGDVITKIDGFSVDSNGTVKSEELEHPIDFNYLIQRKHYLDSLVIEVKRKNGNGILTTNNIKIRLTEQLGNTLFGIPDSQPSKFYIQPSGIDGGYVFVVCDRNYMESYERSYNDGQIQDYSHCPPMFRGFDKLGRNPELYQTIILHSVFKTPETDGHGPIDARSKSRCIGDKISEVNGQAIRNLNDLINAFEDNQNATSIVKFDNGQLLCIAPTVNAQKTMSTLKENYRIAFFASPSVFTPAKRNEIRSKVMKNIDKLGQLDNDNHIPSRCNRI
jgi:hypothetical protein